MSIANLFDGTGKISSQFLPSSITPNQTFAQLLASNNSAGNNSITSLNSITCNTENIGNWVLTQDANNNLTASYGGVVYFSISSKGNVSFANSANNTPLLTINGSKGVGKIYDTIYNVPNTSSNVSKWVVYNATTNYVVPSVVFGSIPFNNTYEISSVAPDITISNGTISNSTTNTIFLQVNVILKINCINTGNLFNIVSTLTRYDGVIFGNSQITPTNYSNTNFMSFTGFVILSANSSFSAKIMQTEDGISNNSSLTNNTCFLQIMQM